MTEVMFYHLQRRPLESVLPTLLQKSLERGWNAIVQFGSPERCSAIDAHLWTFAEESFLPHGTIADGEPETQPVYLTTGEENPNGAAIRFLVDGAAVGDLAPYERVAIIFDGNDQDAVEAARQTWRDVKSAGYDATYWQQSDRGKWEKKA